jgi:preprotein translocase subunit SecF
MFIVNHRSYFYTLSIVLVVLSIVALSIWHLNLGIDFKGGSLLELQYSGARPSLDQVNAALAPLHLGDSSVRPTDSNGFIIRTKSLSADEHQAVLSALGVSSATSENGLMITATTASGNAALSQANETSFTSVGPTLGVEAVNKSIVSIILVILVIVLFIAFAFRTVSEPVSSWKYGIVAIVDLVHNIIIPTGVFAILGHFAGVQIDTLFITALLVILGFSIHDTIVVFDRVRENLRHRTSKEPFAETVGKSISQTFTRSVNTSLVVVFSLVVLYFTGSASTKDFVLALLIGIVAGTYSSIFLGSPLLVTIEKWQNRNARK